MNILSWLLRLSYWLFCFFFPSPMTIRLLSFILLLSLPFFSFSDYPLLRWLYFLFFSDYPSLPLLIILLILFRLAFLSLLNIPFILFWVSPRFFYMLIILNNLLWLSFSSFVIFLLLIRLWLSLFSFVDYPSYPSLICLWRDLWQSSWRATGPPALLPSSLTVRSTWAPRVGAGWEPKGGNLLWAKVL